MSICEHRRFTNLLPIYARLFSTLCTKLISLFHFAFLIISSFLHLYFYHSDPYARVAFANESQVTYMISQTPCPTWDQTLIFSSVEISEDPANVKRNPPSVVIELFDRDSPMVSCFAPIRKKRVYHDVTTWYLFLFFISSFCEDWSVGYCLMVSLLLFYVIRQLVCQVLTLMIN